MGVHPNGPSRVVVGGGAEGTETNQLADLLRDNPNLLADHEKGTLQFLFKVLSVRQALSVQTHPTREQAVVLHAQQPQNYPDPNHKPEMAIAVGDKPFELMCGFREAQDAIKQLEYFAPQLDLLFANDPTAKGDFDAAIEALKAAGVQNDDDATRSALRRIVARLWRASPENLSTTIAAIVRRVVEEDSQSREHLLIRRLAADFPGDVGLLAALVLNVYELKEGEAVFLGPNEPHAYLAGDCVECMACSDNTIRAGLTPKFKDVDTLLANLTYRTGPPPRFEGKQLAEGITEFRPPVAEFAVQTIRGPVRELPAVGASSLLVTLAGGARLCAAGETIEVRAGDVLFIGATVGAVHVEDAAADLQIYRAFTPAPN